MILLNENLMLLVAQKKKQLLTLFFARIEVAEIMVTKNPATGVGNSINICEIKMSEFQTEQ